VDVPVVRTSLTRSRAMPFHPLRGL
jgi:hypothetical protein